MRKPKTTRLDKMLTSLQNRVDRIEMLADFLKKHSDIAEMSHLKVVSNGLVGLIIEEKALVRPQGLTTPGLRIERWSENTFPEVELQDRTICEDVSSLSTRELEELLATIPDPYGAEDDADEDEE